MALLKSGSIDEFAVKAKKTVKSAKPYLDNIKTFSELSQVSKGVESDSFELLTSADPRGVGLKGIKLQEGFEGILQEVFDKTNELYFLAWTWDLSGKPIHQYPGAGVDSKDVLIPLKVGRVREFIGEGINLFPKRKVKGGIALRIQLWESDSDLRNFGRTMSETADAINNSKLSNLLSLISLSTGVSGATVELIRYASVELAKVIGIILQSNGDDYVDFFEGYYTADNQWKTGREVHRGNASVLTINKY